MPDLSRWLDRVTCGDCLEVLREVPDGCVDAVITDQPYGISGPNKVRVRTLPGAPRHASGSSTLVSTTADWGAEDREVGFAWLADVARVLRPGGSLVVFCSEAQWQATRQAGETAGLDVRQMWCWCKTNPPPTPRNNMSSAVEMGWWFRKPDGPVTWNGGHVCPNHFIGPNCAATYAQGHRVHPMQKPAWLMERMVGLWSNEGDLVLDPFAGSASAGVAAVSMGRHYIGIEIDPAHAEAANRRLSAALRNKQPTLALEAAE